MDGYPNTLKVLDTIRRNAYIGKQRHFSASARTNKMHIYFGLPGVIISIVLGSTFFVLISKEIPIEAKWVAAFAGLLAAVLGAIQTFFNFQKISESHRTIANQYLAIQRDCEQLIAQYCDKLLSLDILAERLSTLNSRYQEVNKAAEGLRTNEQDYRKAMGEFEALQVQEAKRGYLLSPDDHEQAKQAGHPPESVR